MTDVLLELSKNKAARKMIESAGVPLPMPQELARLTGPTPERPLDDLSTMVGGSGALVGMVARTLVVAGANPHVESAELADVFREPGEAFGRRARVVDGSPAEYGERMHALVFDATDLAEPADLRRLYEFFHPWLPFLARSGRVVVLGRPAEEASTLATGAVRAALDGFVRSVAKEIGRKGATANLVVVEEGAETRVEGALRFILSPASAFVSGQPLRIRTLASEPSRVSFVRPLEGKVALVTGAGRGIGAATAERLALEGARVVCVDRPADDGPVSRVAERIGGNVILADVSDPDAPNVLVERLRDMFGGVDIVVHNAGITRDKTLARMNEANWDQAIDVNLAAVLRITEALLDGTLRDHGRIVSLSSIAGIAGNMGQTNYAASKAGVIGFTRFLAERVADRGITVNAVAPGFIETPMTAAIPLMIREAGRRLSALGQGGRPEDVAQVISFLASPAASGVTGSVLRVCGGALIGA